MIGQAGGLNQTGKETMEKLDLSSILQEGGPEIQMTKASIT